MLAFGDVILPMASFSSSVRAVMRLVFGTFREKKSRVLGS